ncbi:MAG: rhodanese-like domain-containing protein [Saprospiraceae bacterium]
MKGILIVMIALMTGCGNSSESTSDAAQQAVQEVAEQTVEQVTPTYEVLSVADFKAKMASLGEYHLIDVRTPGEVASGTIENSTNINFSTSNFETELGKLDKSKPLMLFCRSGNRSGKASQMAKNMGFTEIYDLKGGMMAWSQQ